ncbi:hypothetical protein IFHNHDMJ_00999 [Synechococcus sp. CBW1107]|nr:hypothetical protein IFHNHDMJ_00999 [Synechococcus sp. CBW1107]
METWQGSITGFFRDLVTSGWHQLWIQGSEFRDLDSELWNHRRACSTRTKALFVIRAGEVAVSTVKLRVSLWLVPSG